jgi:hypothetical protein
MQRFRRFCLSATLPASPLRLQRIRGIGCASND